MDHIQKLAALFAEFPGIGRRQSQRFVFFLLKQNRSYIRELTTLINSLEENAFLCARCQRFFMKKHNDATMCVTCVDTTRDRTLLMVVERDSDLEAIEKSGTFTGTYFVLGGILPILEKDPESKIRIGQLMRLIERESMDIKEIILAGAVTPESEHTIEFVRTTIQELVERNYIKITTLGRGLSTGTELEYSDADTLAHALKNRS